MTGLHYGTRLRTLLASALVIHGTKQPALPS